MENVTETAKQLWKRSVEIVSKIPRLYELSVALGFLAGCLLLVLHTLFFVPVREFPVNTPVVIEPGMSASEVADLFGSEGVVRGSFVLYVAVVLFHSPEEIKAGAFVFQRPYSVLEIADQITSENPPTEHVRLTFYEGATAADYARLAGKYLPDFDEEYFKARARSYEGFLFPDTYYVPYTFTADELIELLFETYHENTMQLFEGNKTDFTEYEVITIASLLEREGNELENMRMIAGIMNNRMSIDMALQLDASMEYAIDKPLNQLTPADLRIDSPYNTYLYKGLPPTPIGNPGLEAIEAVLSARTSDYLFYITGNDGNFYYAKTFEEHRKNINNYLR